MKDFALITIGMLLLLLTIGCNEDSITMEEEIVTSQGISGSVRFDSTGDGIYDMPVGNEKIVLKDSSSLDSLCPILETYTDEEGNYSFDGVSLFDFSCSMSIHFGEDNLTNPYINFYDLTWEDTTPDGDEGEEFSNINDSFWPSIDVNLNIGEYDDGNDFRGRFYQNRVSGYILEDIDSDGIGDIPVENFRIAFWQINNNLWKMANTDENGYYEFNSLKPDVYIIQISPHINPSITAILSAEDISPDPDGASNGSAYLDLVIEEFEFDDDNNFVIRR